MKYFFSLFVLSVTLWSCKSNSTKVNNSNKINYEELGNNITAQSQGAILTKLSTAIQQKGIESAIIYCNTNISNIMDSLSHVYHCKIRRTSLKLRNTANSPRNDDEVIMLQQLHENYVNHKTTQGRVVERDGKFIYYKPIIVMMNTCLKCHGEPNQEISSNVLKKIQELYPNDQATGFKLNDFRGMWVVEFE